jgi:aminoglycoside 6'-N-acetyltransferase I
MTVREIEYEDKIQWSQMRTLLWHDTEDDHMFEIEEFYGGKSIDIAQVYVVEVNNEVIGFIELNIRNFVEGSRNAKVPYIEAWFIKSEHEGKGYGRKLIEKAEEWAISLGYSELASDTEIENLKSISIHKKLGFKETVRVVCFLKKLN